MRYRVEFVRENTYYVVDQLTYALVPPAYANKYYAQTECDRLNNKEKEREQRIFMG